MDRIDDIALFLRVLDLGSISAAARSLDLSVAVASQRLQRLERDLNVRLLHRTTRQLHPTPEGLLLAEQGRGLVEELEALTDGLRKAGCSIAGTLRVSMSSTFGKLYISPLLPEFLARHPAVRVSVDLNDQKVDLISAGLDLAIRIGSLDDSTLVARHLAINRRVLCASPDYLRRHGAPATPAELENHQCVLLLGNQGRLDTWRMHDRAGREAVVRVTGRIESNQGELVRDASVAGLGISLHSTWHVAADLRAGRLQVVLPDWKLPDTTITALMPQRRLVPPRVRAFVDFLAEKFGDTPPWERVQ
ncbi:LysR family transcriptional regulator [Montanilutibacter psychrotolerans]|uniref:LysR family transcriptional regulator n=1 Tax=Montanilutibacter psychrotolerans TaxID=1327343 RepID=A0A3M8SRD4_9GAMM|nr:LysR family transcriptional regulator [Lysobacter psychrotolerans]RNF82046.1 LysR family transcriptional regulator [Lysobacter psychrotolerans]